MALITIEDLSIGFRGPPLLDGAGCRIEAGQRIGLLGRNGAGKTTFMRMLAGQVEPDEGRVRCDVPVRVALLPQDVPQDITGAVRDVVAQALTDDKAGHWEEWQADNMVAQTLSRMNLDPEVRIETLSSGMKRRVLLARVLVAEPDLLLLDEPTNHLDITAIQWLEAFLLKWRGTLLFVTHDREFLRHVANRILEIDRGKLFDWSCDYDTFLQRKEAALAAEDKQNELFDKKLSAEETWIRQGIKARRTRNEGRVKALERMRSQRERRQSSPGQVRLRIQEAQRSGNLVAAAEDVHFAYDDRPIVAGFSTTLVRGDKVGVIGPNGVGKTTLLKILLGKLTPQQGSVRLGTNLQIAYFDQLRRQLDESRTVQENVADGYQNVEINGRSTHVIGYLQGFLFSPERSRTPVRFLSGGERNRVLLARLFAKPANVIVLDEPTNDLDAETLELLEEQLMEYQGTVLLVSHDRAFLNNVVTSSIVFESTGVKEYVGGYDDWLRQSSSTIASDGDSLLSKPSTSKPSIPKPSPSKQASRSKQPATAVKPRRLSFKEQRELDALPGEIEDLERQLAELHDKLADPAFFRQPKEAIAQEQERLAELQRRLDHCFARWSDLEQRAASG